MSPHPAISVGPWDDSAAQQPKKPRGLLPRVRFEAPSHVNVAALTRRDAPKIAGKPCVQAFGAGAEHQAPGRGETGDLTDHAFGIGERTLWAGPVRREQVFGGGDPRAASCATVPGELLGRHAVNGWITQARRAGCRAIRGLADLVSEAAPNVLHHPG